MAKCTSGVKLPVLPPVQICITWFVLRGHHAALTYRDAKQHEQLGSLAADRDDAGNSSADGDGAAPAAQTREQPNGAAAPNSHDGSRGISSQQVRLAAVWSPPEVVIALLRGVCRNL